MSKGLEALARINKSVIVIGDNGEPQQYAKDYLCIEKELEAIEIIRKEHCLVRQELEHMVKTKWITKEEFDLLIEVLKNEN